MKTIEQSFLEERWSIPSHWVLDEYSLYGLDYFGYTSVVLSLLPKEPVRILDAGVGDGWLANKAAEMGHTVIGIDYHPNAVAYSKILAPKGSFFQIDLRDIPQHTELLNTFDVVLFVEVLEHTSPDSHREILHNLSLVLKSNGQLIMTVPSIYIDIQRWHYKHFSLQEITNLLVESGFNVDEVVYQHSCGLLGRVLFSSNIWRLWSNKYYDLRCLRIVLKWLYDRFFNISYGEQAGRYIIQARRR